MGFAVPAAMGVHLARPDEPVWAISGDGGFQMNMAEIATMVQEGLAVKMAVFNNGYLGMVRQWQRSEEHTSELQSPCNLVCRLLLEKKKKKEKYILHVQ